jgi:hypothetical protein
VVLAFSLASDRIGNMKRSLSRIILVFLASSFLLAGCAAKYTHPTKAPRDFDRDQRDCQALAEKTATKKGVPVCEETRNCLETQKGWRRVLW